MNAVLVVVVSVVVGVLVAVSIHRNSIIVVMCVCARISNWYILGSQFRWMCERLTNLAFCLVVSCLSRLAVPSLNLLVIFTIFVSMYYCHNIAQCANAREWPQQWRSNVCRFENNLIKYSLIQHRNEAHIQHKVQYTGKWFTSAEPSRYSIK